MLSFSESEGANDLTWNNRRKLFLPFPLEKDTCLLEQEEENRKPNWQLPNENLSAWHVQCFSSCFSFCPEANLSQEYHLAFFLLVDLACVSWLVGAFLNVRIRYKLDFHDLSHQLWLYRTKKNPGGYDGEKTLNYIGGFQIVL